MATRRIAVKYCDSCGRQKETSQWHIRQAERSRSMDLCATCAGPLLKLLSTTGRDMYTPVSDDEILEARQRAAEGRP